MEWLNTMAAAFADAGLHLSDVVVSLVVAFVVYGAVQTRQFSSAALLVLSLVSGPVRRQRQKVISRRILSMVRSQEIIQIEMINIFTNVVIGMVILMILLGLQLFEVKVSLRDLFNYYFSNSSDFLLGILKDFGKLFKVAVALAGVYVLFEIFEDAALVRTALNVRYKGPDYLKEHKTVFDPFAVFLLPRVAIFLFAFVFMLFILMLR